MTRRELEESGIVYVLVACGMIHNVSNIEWNLISRCESISTTAICLTHFVDIYSYTCVVFVIFSRTTMQMILKSMVRIDKDVVESVIQVSSGTGADTEF